MDLNTLIDYVKSLLEKIWASLKAVFDKTWDAEVGTKPAEEVEGE